MSVSDGVMPELPEVETWRASLAKAVCGKVVSAVDFVAEDAKVLVGTSRESILRYLPGSRCTGIFRKGKHLWLAFCASGAASTVGGYRRGNKKASFSIGIHMGMTGAVQIEGKKTLSLESFQTDETGKWPPAYCKLALSFGDAGENGKATSKEKVPEKVPSRMAFTNRRRFGRVRFIAQEDPTSVEPYSALGPDALDDLPRLGRDWFKEKLSPSGRAIKSALLDQALVSGLGNWLCDEALYQSKIDPRRKASRCVCFFVCFETSKREE